MAPSQVQENAERAARAIADVVGDGCLVLAYDQRSSALRPLALEHRDRERRAELEHLLQAGDLALTAAGWPGHALAKNLAFRLRHRDAAAAVSPAAAAGELDLGIAAAVVAPLRVAGRPRGVVVAFRDSCDFPYSADEEARVEHLAAGVSPAQAFRAPAAAVVDPLPDRVVEHAPLALWVTDAAGTTTSVNHAACRLAGAPEASLIGEPLERFIEFRPAAHPALASPDRRDQIFVRPDGRELWVSLDSSPLSDPHGHSQGHVHTIVDVGERRNAEVAARLKASAYEAVADFAEIALAGEDFDVLVQEAVALAADALGADMVLVAEMGNLRSTATIRADYGWPRGGLTGKTFPIMDRQPGILCLDELQPVVVRDVAALERLGVGEEAAARGIRSAMAVAIGDGLGFLSAHSRMPGAFSEQDLSFLGLLTAVLAARWEPASRAAPSLALAR